MHVRCMCPIHGKLSFDDIIIKDGFPVCKKCLSRLGFGVIRPRRIRRSSKSQG